MYQGKESGYPEQGALNVADELAIQNLMNCQNIIGSMLTSEEYETIREAIKLHSLAQARRIIDILKPRQERYEQQQLEKQMAQVQEKHDLLDDIPRIEFPEDPQQKFKQTAQDQQSTNPLVENPMIEVQQEPAQQQGMGQGL